MNENVKRDSYTLEKSRTHKSIYTYIYIYINTKHQTCFKHCFSWAWDPKGGVAPTNAWKRAFISLQYRISKFYDDNNREARLIIRQSVIMIYNVAATLVVGFHFVRLKHSGNRHHDL